MYLYIVLTSELTEIEYVHLCVMSHLLLAGVIYQNYEIRASIQISERHLKGYGVRVGVILLLTVSQLVSQSDLALSTQLRLVAIFLPYNRTFWFCMSLVALPDKWTGLSQSLSVNMYTISVTLFFGICILTRRRGHRDPEGALHLRQAPPTAPPSRVAPAHCASQDYLGFSSLLLKW
jgi:hypothetical protein